MPFNLGVMSVAFEMDLSGLTSGVTRAEGILGGLASMGEEIGSVLSEAFSLPDEPVTLLAEELGGLRSRMGSLATSMEELVGVTDAGFAKMAEASSMAASRINENFSSMQSHAQGASNAVRETASSSQHAGGGFMDLFGKLGMGIMGFQMVGQMALQAGSALLMPAASAEQTQMAFTTLLGSSKAAADELNTLNTFAANTNFQTEDIDKAAQKMLAFGFNTKDLIPDITAFGDALAGLSKTSGADLDQVTNALGKIKAQGHLTGESMQEMGDMGIPVWQLLQKETGKTIPELQKMVSQGLIPAKDGIAMLAKGIESSNLAGGMGRQAHTFLGTLSTVMSDAKRALASFGGPILESVKQGLQGLGDVLHSKGFQEFATKTGKQITDIMSNLGKFFSNPAFKEFADLLGGTIAKGFQQMMSALSSPAFGNFVKIIGDVLGNSLKTLMPFLKSIIQDFSDFGKQVGSVLTPIIQNFAKYLASPQFQGFVKVIGEGIAGAVHVALPLISEMVKNVVKFGEEVGQRLQPLIKKFMEWWNVAWPGIAAIFDGVWNEIQGIVKIAWALVSGIIKIGLDLLSGNWKQVWADLKDMLKGVWDGVKQLVMGGLEALGGLIYSAGATILSFLTKPFSDAWDFISNFFGNVGQLFNDLVSLNFGAIPGDMQKLTGLPSFASGVENFSGGLAKVHKDELVYLPQGSSVYTAAQSAAMLAGGGNGEIHLHNHVYLDGREMTAQLMPHMNQAALARLGPRARVA